ncbi:PucR family transcriptional regulator [Actinokineospora bangkokensis]|uniref:PucR family transcriptional regulator n=1 Tax=Actinokineospora bangkokensis TaxID=1193682 RepID=A0A1Q9LPH1_9PSEU|nr:PucR family transcriptional regulator [Actinokineospora bangkokensis]
MVGLLEAPHGDLVEVATAALVEGADLAADGDWPAAVPDLHLHVGVGAAEAERWFADLARRAPRDRPRAVMAKSVGAGVRTAARAAGVALVAVHPLARWDSVLPVVHRLLDGSRRQAAAPDLAATDLFDLARIVARDAGGMVSIEDAQSRVLAYSASDASADELRRLSILGRQGPRDYLRALREWGVFDRIRASDEVIDVPAHPELRTERRLVVGIRGQAGVLGSIWLQQGDRPFSPDAEEVLRGAAAIAAHAIARSLAAPSTEAAQVQRLFGAGGGGVDVPSLAAALHLPQTGAAAVIGLAPHGPGSAVPGSSLRLLASALRPDALVTALGERAYVLLPGYTSAAAVTAWTRRLVAEFETRRACVLRAAIALPVPDLGAVAAARTEVDRVLDGAAFPADRVTTLAESRTAVLLGEVLDLVAEHPELRDPRVDALTAHDRDHGANLARSTAVFLAHHGDVRAAATALAVHPNTLRYRVRRAAEVIGVDLTDPADRLLLELQLALRDRTWLSRGR